MKIGIGIGIDTGGTYTDSVIYDFDERKILFSAKSLTTKEDLSIGIGKALDGLPKEMLKDAKLVSLSTTLATNACVEEKGGRGKLIFIGGYRDVVEDKGQDYGLPDAKEIFFLDGEINLRGEIIKEPNWNGFVDDIREWIKDADAVAVVQHLGVKNPASELKAKELITEAYGVNTICGHELFSDLNYIKRGASALLNARLMPVIDDFLRAVRNSLEEREVSAPVVIVRSDGSMMSEKFTTVRPVETLLCGPAASVKGGIELTSEKDCLIIDMGGTTTDIAIVKDGVPVKAKDGVNIGKWRTFVKAVYIDTFGLGGDSVVRFNRYGTTIELGPSRVVPLSIAAGIWPIVTEKLKALIKSGKANANNLTDFFYLAKEIHDESFYTKEEINLCKALADGPLIFSDLVKAVGTRAYKLPTERLEKEGMIMRCALTPTDIMHIKGDFNQFDKEAALLGAEFGADYLGVTIDELADMIYDKAKFTLYSNIIRMMFEDMYPEFKKNGLPEDYHLLIEQSWEIAKSGGQNMMNFSFTVPSTLVGIGAPIHVFLPDVAKAFNTKCVIPENAGVANALGAIVGNISATYEVEVKPEHTSTGITGYIVFGKSENSYLEDGNEALEIAIVEAKEAVREEAINRGASGDITVTYDIENNNVIAADGTNVKLSTKVIATAIGRVIL